MGLPLSTFTGLGGPLSNAQLDANWNLLGANVPNLLPNSTGELGNLLWATSTFSALQGGFGEGSMFGNAAAISSLSGGDFSNRIACGAGVTLCLSGEITTSGMTAGTAQMQVVAYDASGNSLGQVCQTPAVALGKAAAFYSGTGVTPANTASVAVARYTNAGTGPALCTFFRKIKLSQGALVSPYSQEATLALVPNFPGHVNAVNSPNLLPNSSAELANWNWNASNFAPVSADSNGQGTYWLNGAAISTAVFDQAATIPVGAGTPIVMSGETYAKGATAGQQRFGIDFLDASSNITATISATAVNGADWSFYYVAGVAPANTVAMRPFRGSFTSPTVTASGVAFRRLKIERGTTPSLYSQEANQPFITNLPTHFNAVNSANLLPNSTGELGNLLWATSNFAGVTGTGGEGIFQNQTAISAAIEDLSNNITVGAGVQLNLSYEVNSSGLTAGQAICYIEAFNSSNVSLGNSGSTPGVTTAAAWQFRSVAWVTPANTAYVRIHKTVNNTPTVAQYGVSFRRIKLEQGNYPSLYSQEATVAYLQGEINTLTSTKLTKAIQAFNFVNSAESAIGVGTNIISLGSFTTSSDANSGQSIFASGSCYVAPQAAATASGNVYAQLRLIRNSDSAVIATGNLGGLVTMSSGSNAVVSISASLAVSGLTPNTAYTLQIQVVLQTNIGVSTNAGQKNASCLVL